MGTVAALLISLPLHAYDYTLVSETTGDTALPGVKVGDTVHLLLDTTLHDEQIWGSVQLEYDPAMLRALYVDESFDNYGYLTWWSETPGSDYLCGGGSPYYYTLQGGSTRADQYALEYGDGTAGPTAFIDQNVGRVRFFQDNLLTSGNYEPLLLGFQVLKTGNTTITVKSRSGSIDFGWCRLEQTSVSDPGQSIVVNDIPFSFGNGAVNSAARVAKNK